MSSTSLECSSSQPVTESTCVLNISSYKFVRLDRLAERREELKNLADSLDLKGTILLSTEGINMFLAGEPRKISQFFDQLRQDPVLADIQPKESFSEGRPFRRMLVRIKKEIIAFGVKEIDPEKQSSPKLSAIELKQWLDEGRPIHLLDVRNDYEIELGSFKKAEHLGIHHFREFPQALGKLPEELKNQPIVMFCTGGIRCEKAGPLMQQAGFKQIYQLSGGILKYFEETGGAHWEGSCFVFDTRVALDVKLQPTGDQLCFACQAVLGPNELKSPFYKLGKHCPKCYQSPELQAAHEKAQRQQVICEIASQQLGSQPYDNYRKIHVSRKLAGLTLIEFLSLYQPMIASSQWLEWLDAGQITFEGQSAKAKDRVREGQQFIHHRPETVEPEINPNIELLHEDTWLIVVNKPAPLPTHPSGRFNRNTLTSILEQAYPQQKLRVAHRIDANTSGVVLLSRKAEASRFVQPQFSNGQVKKQYFARIHGHPEWLERTCRIAIEDEPSEGGSRQVTDCQDAANCVTHFRIIHRFDDGSSLVHACPETGRTHQIRVHLAHLGFPIVGDPLYLRCGQIGSNQTLSIFEKPMCLHAHSLSIIHPVSREYVTYRAPCPPWAEGLVQ